MLDPHSPAFFMSHFHSTVLNLHLYLKSMILLGKILSLLGGSSARSSTVTSETKRQFRGTAEFLDLSAAIDIFRLSIPLSASTPLQILDSGQLDVSLIKAHLVPSV